MNEALKHMLETLGCDLRLDNHRLAEVLKEKNGRNNHGYCCPSPDGFDYDCSPRGIHIGRIDGMSIRDARFTWPGFVRFIRLNQDGIEKGEETNMNTSIDTKETFNSNPVALHSIEVRIALHIQEARRNCLEVGICLNEAKDAGLVPHGEWENWVRANTGLNERSAQRLMKAAREVPAGSTLARLDLSKITAILALPEGDREAMAQRAVAEDMTVKQLRSEITKKNNQLIDSRAENRQLEQRATQLEEKLDSARREYDNRRKQLEDAHRTEVGALQLQLQEALSAPAGIGPEAQERIDALTQELADAEAYAEEQARLRQEAQQELLNASIGQDAPGTQRRAFGPENLEAAVRSFLGEVGVMMYMDAELASMGAIDKQSMRRQLDMIGDWLQRVEEKIDKHAIVVE